MKNCVLSFLCLVFASFGAKGQSIFNASLTGNPVNTTGWAFPNGFVNGDEVVLTDPQASPAVGAGAIYYTTPTNLTSCAKFTVNFEYRIDRNVGGGADGLAFYYISNPPSGFVNGGNLGIPNNPKGLVLVFDTYDNALPINTPLIAAYGLNGTSNYQEDNPTGQIGTTLGNQPQLEDGTWRAVTLTYVNGNLTVVHDGTTIINSPYNLSQTGYFGFSASYGAVYSRHTIRNVIISATVPPPAPQVPAASVVYCQGQTPAALTATGNNLMWYADSLTTTGTTTAPTPSTGTPGTTYYYVAQRDTGACYGPRTQITVTVNPLVPASISGSINPSTCNGSNGSISVTGLQASSTFTINYTRNGTPVTLTGTSTSTGAYTLVGLNAATYANIVFAPTGSGCNTITMGPVTLTNPAPPATPVATATPNPICAGNTLSLATTAVAGNTYAWTGPNGFTSNTAAPTITNITTAGTGTYSVVTTNTLTNCSSTAGTVAVTVNPTPVITSVTANQPTTCGNTGSLVINGLVNGSSYTINYSKNGTPQAAITQTAAANAVTIAGQGAGSYTGITVTLGNCPSNIMGPVTLVNPAPPATPVVNANSPLCTGQTLNLSTTGPTTGLTFAWTGPNTFTSTSATPSIANVTTAAAGTYSVVTTSTTTNCSSAPGTTVVVVNTTPAITTATPTGPATCGGTSGTIALSTLANSTAYTVNYLKNGFGASFTGTSNATGTLIVTGLGAGSYTNFTVTSPQGCTSAAFAGPVTLTDPPLPPVPTAASNSPVCSGGTLTLTAAGSATGFTYSWTGPAAYTSAVQNPVRTNATTAMSGTYTVTVTNTTTLCTNTSSTNVIVNQTPAAPTVGSNSPICQGSTLNLTASTIAGATYAWTGPNTFASTAQNPNIPNAQVVASGTYSVIATVNGCPSPAGTTTVTVRPTPATPAPGSNSPVCSGQTLLLTTATVTGGSYAWTGPNSFTSTAQNPSIANVTVAANGSYQLIVTVNTCPSAPGFVAVTVNPTPVAPTVTAITYCQDDVAGPLTAGGTNLKWYTASTGGTPSLVAPTPNTAVAGVFTWYVSQTSVQGCEGPRATLTVTVKAKPAPPVVSSPVQYCQYETVTALTATGTTLRWYSVPTGGTGSALAPTQNTTVAGTYYWYVTQNVNGCESNRQTIQVIVKPKPAPPVVNSPVNVCQGDAPYTLTAQGQNLNWYNVPNAGFPDPAAPVVQTATADTFDYYVTQTVNGCESDRALITVIVRYKPSGFIDVSRQFACAEDTISLNYNGNADGNSEYFWTIPVADATVESGQGTAGPLVIRLIHGGKFQVKLVVNNHGCVSNPIYEDIRVRDLPVLSLSVPENGCVGTPVRVALGGSTMPLDSLEWDFGAGSVSSPDRNYGPYDITYTSSGDKVISVRGRNLGCWSHYATDTIDIHDVPNARIEQVGLPDQKVCIGDSVLLRATYDPSWSYQWFPARYFDTVFNFDNQVMAPILAPGYVGVRVSGGWTGCYTEDSVLIEAKSCCDIAFPDAFTPNGDGRNDIFRAITLGHVETSDFRIMNRWGNTVWKGSNGSQGWDGKMNGQEQQTGVYFYYIKYQCNSGNGTGQMIEKAGQVTLIR